MTLVTTVHNAIVIQASEHRATIITAKTTNSVIIKTVKCSVPYVIFSDKRPNTGTNTKTRNFFFEKAQILAQLNLKSVASNIMQHC